MEPNFPASQVALSLSRSPGGTASLCPSRKRARCQALILPRVRCPLSTWQCHSSLIRELTIPHVNKFERKHLNEIPFLFSHHPLCVRLMFPWGCRGVSPPSSLTTGAPGQRLHYLNHQRALPASSCETAGHSGALTELPASILPTHCGVLLTLDGCSPKFFI